MVSMAKLVMGKFYRQADGQADKLPWHREEPSRVLRAAVQELAPGRRVLDLGCGAGVFSVWMAERGLDVTGLDLFAEAIAMARARAAARAVNVDWVVSDLVDYRPAQRFDLVFDSGCLHSLVGADIHTYKRKLLDLLAPDGRYVLEHWGKRHVFDWRPIGPTRRSERTITSLFVPELSLVASDAEDFAAPLPFGPTVRGVGYRFRRAG